MITETGLTIATGRYVVDPARSTLRFHTTHSFGLGPVSGTFAVRDGAIVVADDPAASTVRASVDAASFHTDKPRRDSDVRSKTFLHVDAFPTIDFVSTAVVHADDGWQLRGDLTVRGVTAPVTVRLVSCVPAGDGYRFRADVRIDRYTYRVGRRGVVARHLDAELDVVAVPSTTPER